MPKPIETLVGADATAFQTAIAPHVEAVAQPFADDAADSATAAAASAAAAAGHATGAAGSAASAATKAGEALAHAGDAADSAGDAAASAATATTKAGEASASAADAATSEGVATTKAGEAAASAAAAAASAASIYTLYPAVTGETGIINYYYAPGDVRRYGVFPDGTDLTGLTFTSGLYTVSASAGTFTQAMVGMVMCSPNLTASTSAVIPRITAVNGNGSQATLDRTAIASQSGAGARVGSFWERDFSTRMTAIYNASTLANVEIYWPPGKYVTSWNLGTAFSGLKVFFDCVEFSGVLHLIADAGFPGSAAALTNITVRGKVTSWDRIGAIGLQNSDVSQCNFTCKSDATKNIFGLVGRGVHIYTQIRKTTFGDFFIEDCGVGSAINTDAAFVLDSSDSHGLTIRSIWVKDSAGHGVFILGPNHEIGSISVDAWGYGAADRQIAETASLAQCQELKGVWLKRCGGSHIGSMRIDQQGSGVRANALYDLMVEDTANAAAAPTMYGPPRIDFLTLCNQKHRGFALGDKNSPGGYADLSVGVLACQPIQGATMDAGYAMIALNANASPTNYGRNRLSIDQIIPSNRGADLNTLILQQAGTDIDINMIDTSRTGMAGQLASLLGGGRIGRIRHRQTGGSGSPTPIVFNPDAPFVIGPVDAAAAGLPSISFLDLTGASNNWQIGPINAIGYRGTPVIKCVNASQGRLILGDISETSNNGTGLTFTGNTNVRLEGGKITGMSKGAAGAAGGNTRCSAASVQVTGNTTNTDLAAGQILTDASSVNVTL